MSQANSSIEGGRPRSPTLVGPALAGRSFHSSEHRTSLRRCGDLRRGVPPRSSCSCRGASGSRRRRSTACSRASASSLATSCSGRWRRRGAAGFLGAGHVGGPPVYAYDEFDGEAVDRRRPSTRPSGRRGSWGAWSRSSSSGRSLRFGSPVSGSLPSSCRCGCSRSCRLGRSSWWALFAASFFTPLDQRPGSAC